jgi:rhamnogalacturonyl hydrolase YesR
MMALVDFLSPPLTIPLTHPTSTLILSQLRALVPALLTNADPKTGAWFLVISQPGTREGNYIETSGTAMFIYALLRAVRLNLVEDVDGKIVAAARKAYEYLVREEVVWAKDGGMGLKGTVRVGSLE